jgi:hypothetical protein
VRGGSGYRGRGVGPLCRVPETGSLFAAFSSFGNFELAYTQLVFHTVSSRSVRNPFFGCCFCGRFETTAYHNHHKRNIPARQARNGSARCGFLATSMRAALLRNFSLSCRFKRSQPVTWRERRETKKENMLLRAHAR